MRRMALSRKGRPFSGGWGVVTVELSLVSFGLCSWGCFVTSSSTHQTIQQPVTATVTTSPERYLSIPNPTSLKMAPFESKSVNVNGPRLSRQSTVGKPDYNVANAFQGFDDALEANDPKARKEKLAAKQSRKSLDDGKPLDLRSEAVSAVRVSGLKPMLLVDVLDHDPWTDYVDFADQDDDLPASSTASSRKRPRPATRGQPSNVQADRFGLDAPPNPLKTYGQDQGLQEPISPGRSSDTDIHAGRQESQGQGQGPRGLADL